MMVKVCGPRTYLIKAGHKARYILGDQLIRAPMKVPNMKLES